MPSECSEHGADLVWGSSNACGDLPLSIILLISDAALWGLLFVVGMLRLIYNVRAASRNKDVAKKMQFFQIWFYSLVHTIMDLLALFTFGDLLSKSEPIPALAVLFFYLFSLVAASQIDVLGSAEKNQGINNMDLGIMIQYIFTVYLPQAVIKTSGHREVETEEYDAEDVVSGNGAPKKEQSKIAKFLTCSILDVTHRPSVYDVKDVVGIQGALLGLPTLFVLLFTIVRSVGVASDDVDTFEFDTLLYVAASGALISAVLGPLLGDWETFEKDKLKIAFSSFFRVAEVLARVGFYIFFFDITKFGASLVLLGEFALMWFTHTPTYDVPAQARVASFGHRLLSCWQSVFFTNYRRIKVDKELTTHGNYFPPAIEFLRFLGRSIVTIVGYLVIGLGNFPSDYTDSVGALFYLGVAANGLVLFLNTVYFLVANKKEVKKSDLAPVWNYWKSLPPLSWCLSSSVTHINRNDENGGFDHYV